MFYRDFTLLTTLVRPEAIAIPQATDATLERAREQAGLALKCRLRNLLLSQRLADPASWRELQLGRRQALEALIVMPPDAEILERVTDLICLIVEESNWAENADGQTFADENRPAIDLQSAETAMLLGWSCHALRSKLSARTAGKVLYEVRRRLFAPFLAHGDYPFMSGGGARPLTILTDILLSAILLETDAGRRANVLRQSLKLLDKVIDARDGRIESLPDASAETAAVADLCLLLRQSTRGQMDLTHIYPTTEWLDALLFPWVDGAYFIDPVSRDMLPALSGAQLFRIGAAAGDRNLMVLGQRLDRMRPQPSASVTGRLLDHACAAMLAAEPSPVSSIRYAATAQSRLMISRMGKLTFAMHCGGDCGNAGNIILFADGDPILVESPAGASVPVIGGYSQLRQPASPPESAFETPENRDLEVMSVDLSTVYPRLARAYTAQRTAMIQREERSIQLVDSFELGAPSAIRFDFMSLERPEYLLNGMRLGPVTMLWEGELKPYFEPLKERFTDIDGITHALFRIELTTVSPVLRGFFPFHFQLN